MEYSKIRTPSRMEESNVPITTGTTTDYEPIPSVEFKSTADRIFGDVIK